MAMVAHSADNRNFQIISPYYNEGTRYINILNVLYNNMCLRFSPLSQTNAFVSHILRYVNILNFARVAPIHYFYIYLA